MNKNGRNLKGLTALDVAESLDDGVVKTEIVNALRSAAASEGSSLPDVCSLAEFLMLEERFWERIFGFVFSVRRVMSMEMRNLILVVAVLIATATFQAVLSPPGGIPDNHNLPTNNTITTSNNPYKQVLFQNNGRKLTYESFFFRFYFLNTVCFSASVMVIIIVLPFHIVSIVLHMSLVFLALSYGISFFVISPSYFYASISMGVSCGIGLLAYIMKSYCFNIKQLFMIEGVVPLMSYSHLYPIRQRLQMLHRGLDNP